MPSAPTQALPEAAPMVQLPVRQVSLHEVHVPAADPAGTADGAAPRVLGGGTVPGLSAHLGPAHHLPTAAPHWQEDPTSQTGDLRPQRSSQGSCPDQLGAMFRVSSLAQGDGAGGLTSGVSRGQDPQVPTPRHRNPSQLPHPSPCGPSSLEPRDSPGTAGGAQAHVMALQAPPLKSGDTAHFAVLA